jgi:hypothetical protein
VYPELRGKNKQVLRLKVSFIFHIPKKEKAGVPLEFLAFQPLVFQLLAAKISGNSQDNSGLSIKIGLPRERKLHSQCIKEECFVLPWSK